MVFGVRTGCKFWLCYLLAMWSKANTVAFLSLSFSVCIMGDNHHSFYRVVGRIQWGMGVICLHWEKQEGREQYEQQCAVRSAWRLHGTMEQRKQSPGACREGWRCKARLCSPHRSQGNLGTWKHHELLKAGRDDQDRKHKTAWKSDTEE